MRLRWRSPTELILSVSASNIGWKMGRLSISKLVGRLDQTRAQRRRVLQQTKCKFSPNGYGVRVSHSPPK
jgi:hypothetical protein